MSQIILSTNLIGTTVYRGQLSGLPWPSGVVRAIYLDEEYVGRENRVWAVLEGPSGELDFERLKNLSTKELRPLALVSPPPDVGPRK